MTSEDPTHSTTSASSRAQRRYQTPSRLDFFLTPDPDIQGSIPSPPYRRDPSSTTLPAVSYQDESPAYRSRSDLNLPSMSDEKLPQPSPDTKEATKPSVQFPDDVESPPLEDRRPSQFSRFESSAIAGELRAPSLAGTDDEDSVDDYDWSGEEDLVDEEAKFEQSIGVRTMSESFGMGR